MYPFTQPEPYRHSGRTATLAEHLGYSRRDKLLIVNADDFGLTPAINEAVLRLAKAGRITSTTLMVPGMAYQHALTTLRSAAPVSVGLHITMTTSFRSHPTAPVSARSDIESLVTDSGNFYEDRDTFFVHATPAHALLESAAQLDKAISDGIDLTHIDSHEGTLQLRPEFARIYVELALRYNLPVRMGSRALLRQLGLEENWISRLRKLGMQFPDNLVYLPVDQFDSFDAKRSYVFSLMERLPPGVTEMFFHPSLRTSGETTLSRKEGQADAFSPNDMTSHVRVWDYELLMSEEFGEALSTHGIQLIGFRALRELMRR